MDIISIGSNFAAEEASGIGALGFDGKAFLIQLVTFLLAFFVLKRYAFKPILKVLEDRRKTIESGVKLGEQMQREQAEFESKVAGLLQEARKEADGIINVAQDAGRQTVRDAEDKAKQKAAGILAEAEGRIAQEAARVRQQMEKELATLVAEATEAVLEQKIDTQRDMQLIEKAIKERAAA